MESQTPEFTAGDTITITTTISHEANIAGVYAQYVNQDEPYVKQGVVIAFEKGVAVHGSSIVNNPVPGPYLNGKIELETTVRADEKPGLYRLQAMTFLTAGAERLQIEDLPDHSFHILEEPTTPPIVAEWDFTLGSVDPDR
jgi:hypothetical protein